MVEAPNRAGLAPQPLNQLRIAVNQYGLDRHSSTDVGVETLVHNTHASRPTSPVIS